MNAKNKKSFLILFTLVYLLFSKDISHAFYNILSIRSKPKIVDYYIENLNEAGFDFYIEFDDNYDIARAPFRFWKSGNYNEMKGYEGTLVDKNKFHFYIDFESIGSGTDYIYIGVHVYTNNNTYFFVTDLSLKLDVNPPNVEIEGDTKSIVKDYKLQVKANDDMNTISNITLTKPNGEKEVIKTYSYPKVLVISGRNTSNILKNLGYDTDNISIQELSQFSNFTEYDVIIYDGGWGGINSTNASILNKAFKDGVNILSNGNDSFVGIDLIDREEKALNSLRYRFEKYDNNAGLTGGYALGKFNRFTSHIDNTSESDGAYHKVYPSKNTFIISNVRHEDNTISPGILYKTSNSGAKWIHVQSANNLYNTNTFRDIFDELMHGTNKSRMNYEVEFNIFENGEYVIEVEDFSGNITRKVLTINNIDNDNPIIAIDKNKTEWTNKPVEININTKD